MSAYHLVLLLGPLALCGAFTRARSTHLVLLSLLTAAVVVLCGLRWGSDADHMEYAALFAETPLLHEISFERVSELYGEPGYLLVSSILRSAGIGFFAMTFLSAMFAIVTKAVVVQRFVRSSAVVMFLYLCIHLITIEFIQIRWAIASSLIALAFFFQFRRRIGLALLCLCLAISFHYFSIVFLLVALLLEIKHESHLYASLALLGIVGGVVAWVGLDIPNFLQGDAYILQRTLRYINDPLSTLGVMSYAKISMYPIAYIALTSGNAELHQDAETAFLRKVSFTLVFFTFALSAIPVMHHRAVVLTDLFSLILLVRVIDLRFLAVERFSVMTLMMMIPFSAWFLIDIDANFTAHTLTAYRTWIPLIF